MEIGRTDGYRYVGIEPPVDDDLRTKIFDELGEEVLSEAVGNGRALSTTTPDNGPAHSELELTSIRDDYREAGTTLQIALSIANTLKEQGHSVTIEKKIRDIGFGHYLFGGQDNRLG
jgi:hypothetical protein